VKVAVTFDAVGVAPGDYALTLKVANNDSSTGDLTRAASFHVAKRHAFYVAVAGRWNLLSLPVRPPDAFKDSVYPASISGAFAYEGGYILRDSLSPGEGFWLKFGSTRLAGVDGPPIAQESLAVSAGWNLIGPAIDPMSVGDIQSIPGGMNASPVYGYEGVYSAVDTMFPGKGYWIKTDQSGMLILSPKARIGPLSAITIRPSGERPPPPPSGPDAADGPPVRRTGMNGLVPGRSGLAQNYPNPFNPKTEIAFEIAGPGFVSVKVYDVLGREVATLVNQDLHAGTYRVSWDASTRPGGVYFYKLDAGRSSVTKMMLLSK
jgi:hypothetical protein